MAMKVRELIDRLNRIKASVDAGETPDLAEPLQRVRQRLREAFGPEQLKAALKDDLPAPSTLEEDITTLTMEWMQRRGSR